MHLALILVLIIFKHTKYTIRKNCVDSMVGGDRNLFVRKGGASQKKIGIYCSKWMKQ